MLVRENIWILVSEVQLTLVVVVLTVFYLWRYKGREGMARNVGEYLGVVSIVELASTAREIVGELLDSQTPEFEVVDSKVKYKDNNCSGLN